MRFPLCWLLLPLLYDFPSDRTRWRSATADNSCKYPRLEAALLEYQEPTKVDKIAKLDKQLGETKDILYKTIDAVLARGEKLDDLVEKSSKLSEQSKVFYKVRSSA